MVHSNGFTLGLGMGIQHLVFSFLTDLANWPAQYMYLGCGIVLCNNCHSQYLFRVLLVTQLIPVISYVAIILVYFPY